MQLIKKMVLLFWLPPHLYHDVYSWVVIVLAVVMIYRYLRMTSPQVLNGRAGILGTIIIAVGLILFIGTRPPLSAMFGDSKFYYISFCSRASHWLPFEFDFGKEFGWDFIHDVWRVLLSGQTTLSQFEGVLFTIALIYVGATALSCIRIDRRHSFTLFLFVLTCFSFYAYGVNGLRNGMACSLVLLALSFMNTGFYGRIIAVVFCCMAYTVHHSTALPSLCMFLSYYFIRSIKWSIAFWLGSIVISIVAGSVVESIFTGLGFDDRLAGYLQASEDVNVMRQTFSHIGFRWDFLLYSAVPILLGWYAVMKRDIKDRKYKVILNTYILSNAFWVMMIRASYSNRFAYLSWFMYGFVLAYPLLNFRLFNKQGAVVACALIYQLAFFILI